jgi:predicted DNA-binding antitoxin AbrB/MazE fold protein
MVTTIEATYDGEVLRPEEPLSLEPYTRVRITIEMLPLDGDKPMSFLDTARSLNLEGPPDWSANVDKYLYGFDDPKDA